MVTWSTIAHVEVLKANTLMILKISESFYNSRFLRFKTRGVRNSLKNQVQQVSSFLALDLPCLILGIPCGSLSMT